MLDCSSAHSILVPRCWAALAAASEKERLLGKGLEGLGREGRGALLKERSSWREELRELLSRS